MQSEQLTYPWKTGGLLCEREGKGKTVHVREENFNMFIFPLCSRLPVSCVGDKGCIDKYSLFRHVDEFVGIKRHSHQKPYPRR